jgi:hypothetical protein
MKRVLKIATISILALLATGCAVTEFDKSVNFSRYATYSWGNAEASVKHPLYKSDLITKKIRASVEKEFARRGITKSGQPDFLVNIHTHTEDKERISNRYSPYFPMYGFYPFGFYPFAWAPRYPTWGYPVAEKYTEGTLILDVVDKKTNELVWRGSVSGTIDGVKNLERQIDKAIRAIMKKYPVPATEEKLLPNEPSVS